MKKNQNVVRERLRKFYLYTDFFFFFFDSSKFFSHAVESKPSRFDRTTHARTRELLSTRCACKLVCKRHGWALASVSRDRKNRRPGNVERGMLSWHVGPDIRKHRTHLIAASFLLRRTLCKSRESRKSLPTRRSAVSHREFFASVSRDLPRPVIARIARVSCCEKPKPLAKAKKKPIRSMHRGVHAYSEFC